MESAADLGSPGAERRVYLTAALYVRTTLPDGSFQERGEGFTRQETWTTSGKTHVYFHAGGEGGEHVERWTSHKHGVVVGVGEFVGCNKPR